MSFEIRYKFNKNEVDKHYYKKKKRIPSFFLLSVADKMSML